MSHPKFPNFKEVGQIDVDAGSIWVGDGCYVIKDPDEARPKDLGDDWCDICSRFFERSGHNALTDEVVRWQSKQRTYAMKHPESQAFIERQSDIASKWSEEVWAEHSKLISALEDRYAKEHPFEQCADYTGCANFTHDSGYGGMGMMISTFYGDGSYPVYIEYSEDGRPRRVLIDFDPSCEKEDEPEDQQTEVEKLRAALEGIGPWLSASLEEKSVCKEYADACQKVFEALGHEVA